MKIAKALDVFSIKNIADIDEAWLKKTYRNLAKEKHPDKKTGSNEDFVKLQSAYKLLLKEVNKETKTDENINREPDQDEFNKNKSSFKVNTDTKKESGFDKLSKDEILNQYFKVTNELSVQVDQYKDIIDSQTKVLTTIQNSVQDIVQAFEEKKNKLRLEFEAEIRYLQKTLEPGLMKKLFFFFLPKFNSRDFWEKYNSKVAQYSHKDAELDVEFYKLMLKLYGDGLNKVTQKFD